MYKKRSYTKRSIVSDFPERKDATRPKFEGVTDTILSYKMNRDLPKSGSSVTVKLDPYTEVLPGSDPYAIVNGDNRKVGGKYGGKDNLDAGYTQQFQMSEKSTLLHAFDSFMTRAKINYRYLPIKATDIKRGKGYQKQMINSVNEILSLFNSTTFTNMAINQYYVKTDMPINGVSDPDKWYAATSAEGMFIILINYQIMLQQMAGVFNAYNKFRSNVKMMYAMSWNREVAKLNSYFGLTVDKASFKNQFKALSKTLIGEYFDKEWMEQSNMIGALVGRKSNSMLDPLMEFIATHAMPKWTLALRAGSEYTTVYSTDMLDTIVKNSEYFKATNFQTFEKVVDEFAIKLSVNDTLYWARKNSGALGENDIDRFNWLAAALTVFIDCANEFKRDMGDVRAVLNVLGRSNVNKWTLSVQLNLLERYYAEPLYNLTIQDLYRTMLSGSQAMTFNATTMRWSTTTQWNKYSGIPEYDAKAGGAFLSFCTKDLEYSSSDSPFATDYLPVLITTVEKEPDAVLTRPYSIYAVNRLGTSIALNYTDFDPTVNPSTARLSILPTIQGDISIRVPYAPSYKQLAVIDQSYLLSACLAIFGWFANTDDPAITAATDLAVEPDIICMLGYEIEDLTEQMTTYARVNGPFVVNVDDASDMGFLIF